MLSRDSEKLTGQIPRADEVLVGRGEGVEPSEASHLGGVKAGKAARAICMTLPPDRIHGEDARIWSTVMRATTWNSHTDSTVMQLDLNSTGDVHPAGGHGSHFYCNVGRTHRTGSSHMTPRSTAGILAAWNSESDEQVWGMLR